LDENNKYIFGVNIQILPIIFETVIESLFMRTPYTKAIKIPKYDKKAYKVVSKLEIAKNLNKYPNKPIIKLIIREADRELFISNFTISLKK